MRVFRTLGSVLAVALVLGLQQVALAADVLTVGPAGQFPTIQGAVDAASDDDIILVAAGDYFSVTIVDKALTILGEGEVNVEDGRIILDFGNNLTGVTWTQEFPKSNFEIELDAMRVEDDLSFIKLEFAVSPRDY